ncbi:hypothetical protein V496_01909 [Pseudogymnoascus sp. VKM F-4515 (FW-2607)]|nr:hypothetical protein V496_01909 [Pseudogymnoascus sp. VKM F-4515 (FW-2607)]
MEPLSKVDELTQWFGENGGHLNEAIEMFHSCVYGYHYVAKSRPIDPKETVGRCPFSLTLSHLNVISAPPAGILNCSLESVCSKLLDNPKINRGTIAILFLAEQRLRGRDSFWFPYIQLLPTEVDMTTPLWFKDEELVYLKGTNLLSNNTPPEKTSVGQQEGLYREQWELGISELKDAGVSTDNLTCENTKSSFPVLYPVLDIFNHRLGTKVGWQFHKGDFNLCLEERVEQGMQVFNNYSPKGNEDLLMGFGFCIPDNPYDQVAVRLGEIQPEMHRKLRDDIPDHWRSETWEPKESVFYLRAASQYTPGYSNMYGVPKLSCLRGIPPELAKSLYLIILDRNKLAALSEEVAGEKKNWVGIIDALLHQMEYTLMGINQWNGELPDFPSTAGAKAALIYRTGQVKILEEVISELKKFMDPLRAGVVSIEDSFME